MARGRAPLALGLGLLLLACGAAGLKPAHTRPRVLLKVALDLQGAVDDLSAEAKRFTCAASLDKVHEIRAEVDAVLVGVGTVARDDCTLTVRRVPLPPGRPQPVRVVVDPGLRTPPDSKLLHDGLKTLLLCRDGGDGGGGERAAALASEQTAVVPVAAGADGAMAPEAMLAALADEGIERILVEGGPSTALRFLRARCVDEMILVRAPVTFADPVPSGITDDVIREARLAATRSLQWGVDDVTYYHRDDDAAS